MLTRVWTGSARPEWTLTVTRTAAEDEPAPLTDASDDALIDAFVAGRRDAFDVIVARHGRLVYQVCYRFVGNHEDASDLAQDVFVRAPRGLAAFKRQSSLSTWLYRIAVNVSLNRVSLKTPAPAPLPSSDTLV